MNPLVFSLAWRSLWRHRRRTLITLSSIAVGIACGIFFVTLGHGTYFQLTRDAVRLQGGHITIEHPQYRDAPAIDLYLRDVTPLSAEISKIPAVENVKPLILAQGVAKSSHGAVGVAVIGVSPHQEAAISPLPKQIFSGEYLSDSDDAWAVLGEELAESLKLKVGRKFVITTNDAQGNLVETLVRVKGTFRTGSTEIDNYVIQVPISFARTLYSMPEDSVTQLGVLLKDPDSLRKTLRYLTTLVGTNDRKVRSWEEILPEVAAWIRLDRTSNYIFQSVILFLVLFTIFNTLLMSVLERQKEFSVLLAIGTPRSLLCRQIFMEAVFLGLMGSGTGVAVGSGIAGWVQKYGLDLSRFYDDGLSISGFAINTTLHSRLTVDVLLVLGGFGLISTILVSFPAMSRIVRMQIVDWLR